MATSNWQELPPIGQVGIIQLALLLPAMLHRQLIRLIRFHPLICAFTVIHMSKTTSSEHFCRFSLYVNKFGRFNHPIPARYLKICIKTGDIGDLTFWNR